MSDKTGIEWTNATWNPVTGCTKVSAGCKHCYAERDWARLSANQTTRYHGRKFTDVQSHSDVLALPIRWTKPRRIFVNSMSDLFHPDVPDAIIDSAFGVMWACLYGRNEQPGHVFQVLTKRPERMRAYLQQDRRESWAHAAIHYGGGSDPDGLYDQTMEEAKRPHPRIWLGVSIEDQSAADERIPLLLETTAAVRWISAEPLLGAVDLANIKVPPEHDKLNHSGFYPSRFNALTAEYDDKHYHQPPAAIDWVVVGGESGPKARPMHPQWARDLRDQCAAAGVPFIFKQWGEWAPPTKIEDLRFLGDMMRAGKAVHVYGNGREHDGHFRKGDEHMLRVGKKLAGRLLDDVQHDGYPKSAGLLETA